MLKLDWNLLFTVINLLILYLLMRRFLFKPVAKVIAARQEEVEKQFAEAEAEKAEAAKIKDECRLELDNLAQTKEAQMLEVRTEAGKEYDRIVTDAKQQAEGIVTEAKKNAELEKDACVKAMRSELSEMIVNASAKVVGTKCCDASDRALFDEFLEKAGE